jgi:acetyltransferase-like isoleucine patch superfamily enzyme
MPVKEFGNGSRIRWEEGVLPPDLEVGPDVVLDVGGLDCGRQVRIGASEAEAFRYPAGVRIEASVLELGDGVRIGRHVWMRGGHLRFGRKFRVGHQVTIHVSRRLLLGDGGTIHAEAEISGVDVEIGRQVWILGSAKIGGGSAFEVQSSMRAGHWFHLGVRGFVNTARAVVIGDEVGLGTGTSLYTHGAYPSALEGKPVAFGPISIGDRSWLPGAVVNPTVNIGADCVVGVGSVVTRNIPAGSLAAGIPAKVLKEGAYPRPLDRAARLEFFADFLQVFGEICAKNGAVALERSAHGVTVDVGDALIGYFPELPQKDLSAFGDKRSHVIALTDQPGSLREQAGTTIIDCSRRQIQGPASALSERLLNQLRRYGIRFNYDADGGRYVAWEAHAEHVAR